MARGLPPVARRRRGSDRRDRLHRRLVHRLLRANTRRAARRPRRSVGAVEAGWKRALRTILAVEGASTCSPRSCSSSSRSATCGLRLHARSHHDHRRHRRRAVHPPDAAAARARPGSSRAGTRSAGSTRTRSARSTAGARSSASRSRVPAGKVGVELARRRSKRQTIAERKAAELDAVGGKHERREGLLMASASPRSATTSTRASARSTSSASAGSGSSSRRVMVLDRRSSSRSLARRLQLRHRVPRRIAVPDRRASTTPDRSPRRTPSHRVVPDAVAARHHRRRRRGVRVQTDQLDRRPRPTEVADALAEAYDVTETDVTSSFIGATWGADITRQAHPRPRGVPAARRRASWRSTSAPGRCRSPRSSRCCTTSSSRSASTRAIGLRDHARPPSSAS